MKERDLGKNDTRDVCLQIRFSVPHLGGRSEKTRRSVHNSTSKLVDIYLFITVNIFYWAACSAERHETFILFDTI